MTSVPVSSGSSSVLRVTYLDLETLAIATEGMNNAVGELQRVTASVAVDGDLLLSAILDPGGFAAIEASCTDAILSPDGMVSFTLQLTVRSWMLKASVAVLRAADTMVEVVLTVFDATNYLTTWLVTGELDWWGFLEEHPGLREAVATGLATLLGVTLGKVAPDSPFYKAFVEKGGGVPGAAAAISLLYGPEDGKTTAKNLGAPATNSYGFTSANDPLERLFSGLVDRYSEINTETDPDSQGKISVRAVKGPDGKTRYIVDIPGTQDWHALSFGEQEKYLNDLQTNVKAMAGYRTEYQAAIVKAMQDANIPADAEVMLVGHSQGGIVAMRAAQDSGTDAFPYKVTHVLTAGAPVGGIAVSPNINVLSIENTADLVPSLDGSPNSRGPNRDTVYFTAEFGEIGKNHDMTKTYLPAARDLDGNAAAQNFLETSTNFYSSDEPPSTSVYQVTRDAPPPSGGD